MATGNIEITLKVSPCDLKRIEKKAKVYDTSVEQMASFMLAETSWKIPLESSDYQEIADEMRAEDKSQGNNKSKTRDEQD